MPSIRIRAMPESGKGKRMTAQELNTLFGKNLRYYRKKKNMSQSSLADEAGTKRYSIIAYEKSRTLPNCRNLAMLAFVLGVEVWQLYYDKEGSGR